MSVNIEYVGHAAYTLGILSFMLKDMLWLRAITVVAASLCVVYNYAAPALPMWTPIYWNTALVAINIIQIGIIFYDRREIVLDEKERWLYTTVFPNFSLADFKRLMQAASWNSKEDGDTLIVEGQEDSNLLLIAKGKCQVCLPEGPVAELLNGEFIGEMSFLSGKSASATVSTVGKVDYISWDRSKLNKLFFKSPSLHNSIKSAISHQLTEKIVRTSKGRHVREESVKAFE